MRQNAFRERQDGFCVEFIDLARVTVDPGQCQLLAQLLGRSYVSMSIERSNKNAPWSPKDGGPSSRIPMPNVNEAIDRVVKPKASLLLVFILGHSLDSTTSVRLFARTQDRLDGGPLHDGPGVSWGMIAREHSVSEHVGVEGQTD